MSVLFLPPSAGAASVPDATETVSGKIRIATSAEATTGTDDTTAITPLKLKSVVDAAVVGGVTYQGTFDASSPADLSSASKGDLYIISVAGTYQGQTWAVGDHLLINADMGGTLDPAKIDKVDNTDSVTSVAGRTGAVTLSTADVSGLATVASTGAYSDLTGAPTLGTSAAEDVGTLAGNVVQLDGSARLPAVDGSLLTGITASVAALDDVGDVNITSVSDGQALVYDSGASEWVNGSAGAVVYQSFTASGSFAINTKDLHVVRILGTGINVALSASTGFGSGLVLVSVLGTGNTLSGVTFRRNGEGAAGGVTTLPLNDGERRLFYIENNGLFYEVNATLLDRLAGVSITSPSNGEALIYNSTSGDWENGTVSASVAALNDIGDVSAAAPSDTNVIKYNSTSGDWESGAVAYSEVTGTPTLATVATTGAYSDLTGTPTLGTAAALDVGTSANNIVQLDGSGLLPAVDGSQLTNLPTGVSKPNVTSATPGATYTISTSTGFEEAYLLTPSTACAVTIPTASSATSGYKYQIKNLSANTVTISPSSGTIDGSASFDLSVQYATVTLLSDGTNWFVI